MHEASSRESFWAGIVLVAAPLLTVFAMAHHPTAGGESTAERLASMVRLGALASWVHGILIALVLAIFLGLLAFAARLGWSFPVRAGAIVYGLGVVCMVGAALVSGFIVPGLAERYVDASRAAMEAAMPAFHLSHEANQALAKVGTVAMSAGIFLWSLVLVNRPGWLRALGLFGLLVGSFPVLGLLLGRLELDVHGMFLVVLGQALWQVAAGAWMLRRDESHVS